MTLQEFKSNFGGQDLPNDMLLLFDFQDKFGAESYVAGFGLLQDDKCGLQYGWSDNNDFLNALMPFAQAGEGSIYCLWDNGTSQELNQMPIVYFDSEGDGETIIARNFLEFLQVLLLEDDKSEWKPEHYPEFKQFVTYLFESLKLEISQNTDAIVIACKPFQENFDTWKNQYLNS